MLKHLIDDCDGQDLVEYALLIALIALGAVTALSSLQDVIKAVWTAISTNLSS